MKRIGLAAVASMIVAVVVAAAAIAAGNGVTNGGFESGSLAPWTAINTGFGAWQASDGSGLSTTCANVLPGPRTGGFDGLFNQGGGSAEGLMYQDVVVPADATMLAFALTWNNGNGTWLMTPGEEFDYGQWISVDVLKAGSDPETFDSNDIIATPVREASGSANAVGPWQEFAVQLGGYAGKTVRLRFAANGAIGCMPFAVDDVGFVQNAVLPDERIAYCSVAGNTWPDGSPIAPGTFLNLEAGQPATDTGYTGAVTANFVAGEGLTCGAAPAGDTLQGLAGAAQHVAGGVYPYYAAPSS